MNPDRLPASASSQPGAAASLLTVARPDRLDDWLASGDDNGRAMGVHDADLFGLGVYGWAENCLPDLGFLPVDPDDNPTNPERLMRPASAVPRSSFHVFQFYAHIDVCVPSIDDPEAQARALLDFRTAREISRELWTGRLSQGHSLARDAVDLTPSTGAVGVKQAVGLIQRAVGGPGTWHAPVELEAEMRDLNLIRDDGRVLVGPGQWPVSFGPGYPVGDIDGGNLVSSPWRPNVKDRQSTATVNSAALATNEVYLVGHAGRVEAAWRDLPNLDGDQRVTSLRALNRTTAMLRREAVFRYDTTTVWACRVALDWDVAAPVPAAASPAAVAGAGSVPAPSIGKGATPAAVAGGGTVPNPAVTATGSAQPAAVPGSGTVPAPTVTP